MGKTCKHYGGMAEDAVFCEYVDGSISIDDCSKQNCEQFILSNYVKIDETDHGCCSEKCSYLSLDNSKCNLYDAELHGTGLKTRCGKCHVDSSLKYYESL